MSDILGKNIKEKLSKKMKLAMDGFLVMFEAATDRIDDVLDGNVSDELSVDLYGEDIHYLKSSHEFRKMLVKHILDSIKYE